MGSGETIVLSQPSIMMQMTMMRNIEKYEVWFLYLVRAVANSFDEKLSF